MELSEKKLKTRDYVVIASLLFGLFFGAGNLIFPLLVPTGFQQCLAS